MPDGRPTVCLYWIPLGAGGTGFVSANGRVYEALTAWRERRERCDLFHTALEVTMGESRWVVETMWPSPGGEPAARGVVLTAPVFSRALAFTRVFRYEVRRWAGGVLPDADRAVGGARPLSTDVADATRLLGLVDEVPGLTWGRRPRGVADMWNSNSVVSWLIVRSGISLAHAAPPPGGRAPGWEAGVALGRGRGQLSFQYSS